MTWSWVSDLILLLSDLILLQCVYYCVQKHWPHIKQHGSELCHLLYFLCSLAGILSQIRLKVCYAWSFPAMWFSSLLAVVVQSSWGLELRMWGAGALRLAFPLSPLALFTLFQASMRASSFTARPRTPGESLCPAQALCIWRVSLLVKTVRLAYKNVFSFVGNRNKWALLSQL